MKNNHNHKDKCRTQSEPYITTERQAEMALNIEKAKSLNTATKPIYAKKTIYCRNFGAVLAVLCSETCPNAKLMARNRYRYVMATARYHRKTLRSLSVKKFFRNFLYKQAGASKCFSERMEPSIHIG
jgi:hypothetical protein